MLVLPNLSKHIGVSVIVPPSPFNNNTVNNNNHFFFYNLEIMESTDRVFSSLLDRKAEADAKRNTLAVLRRFQFIFGLPAAIREAIKDVRTSCPLRPYKEALSFNLLPPSKGEYDKVIRVRVASLSM